MDDEHIRVARWMRRVEPGEVDDSDGEEPFPLLDVDEFGNDGDATDGSGSEARSDGGRLPGAIRGFGAVLDENGNPNGWFGPTGQFKRGVKDGEESAAVEETDEATSSVGLEDDKELVEGKDVVMKTPTVTHVEHVEKRPESPLKRKRLE